MISLNDVKPGMKITKPVMDKTGIILLKEGIELTEIWIERLKARKIESIVVEDDATESVLVSQEELEKIHREIDEGIDNMFSDVVNDPIMQEIAKCAKKFHKSRYKFLG